MPFSNQAAESAGCEEMVEEGLEDAPGGALTIN